MFLGFVHGIYLSIRQLKRILANLGLGRRRNRSNIDDICRAMELELQGSGSRLGYRLMTRRLISEYNLIVDQEKVVELLKIMDPDGVSARSRHRLQRREYKTEGPNHVWHIDGYDKLKPFGFCIHGAIDGYSRRLMWLEVDPSNNNPGVIAHYYIDCVEQMGGAARIIRADCGTENVRVAGLQRFFNNDNDSFLYGKSCSNQRIEALEGECSGRVALTGGCVTLKTCGIVVCFVTVMTNRQNALNFALYEYNTEGTFHVFTTVEFTQNTKVY